MKLEGKVALVLGSIKGIGRGIALALAKEGVSLALTYYDWQEHLAEANEILQEAGADYFFIKVDLTQPDQAQRAVEKAAGELGRIDILINNIERGGWPVVHGCYTPEQWDIEVATTLKAKWWAYHYSLPHLKASGDGAVVNISSIAGILGRGGAAGLVFNDAYCAANRGIRSFTEMWAQEGSPEVRVNEIMLGFCETRHGPGTRGWGVLTESQRKEIIDHTLLKRIGNIDDVAKAVIFIIRDALFMTGAMLRLDGGYMLGGEYIYPMPAGVIQNQE
ncbi:MAG: SDR family oxidoreductase [Pseudomonadota bacterium]